MRRAMAEGLQKDKLLGLPVFATALRCLPYILPDAWDASRIAAELPGVCLSHAALMHQRMAPSTSAACIWEGACLCPALVH